MTTTNPTDDDSTEPEVSDERLRQIAADLNEFLQSDSQLSLVTSSVYVQQLDNPLTDDWNSLTVFMDGDVGSGATKATIIQAILDSDLPLRLTNTSDGNGQITFEVA